MSVFKRTPQLSTFLEFLDSYCKTRDGMYIVDHIAYKYMCTEGTDKVRKWYCKELAENHYNLSHIGYAIREFTFVSLCNIIRQVCSCLRHPFTITNENKDGKQYKVYYVSTEMNTEQT
jgi:hypothetical protein